MGKSAAKSCPSRIGLPFDDICGNDSSGRGALFRSPAMDPDNEDSNASVRFSADTSAHGRGVQKWERKYKSRRREAGRREEHRKKSKKRTFGMVDEDHNGKMAPGSFDGALSDKICGHAQEQCVNRMSPPTPMQKNAVVVRTRAVGYIWPRHAPRHTGKVRRGSIAGRL